MRIIGGCFCERGIREKRLVPSEWLQNFNPALHFQCALLQAGFWWKEYTMIIKVNLITAHNYGIHSALVLKPLFNIVVDRFKKF